MNLKKISFVIPCYGSEKTIEFVINEIIEVISCRREYDYEIIAVNDCSPDKVYDKLCILAGENKKIKIINFAKNMNRPGAVMAGLNYVKGDYVVVMDDDGQCPMDKFWTLFKPVEDGHDVSIAKYPERKQSVFKSFGTFVNKKMTEYILNRPKEMEFTNFMIIQSYIVDEIVKYFKRREEGKLIIVKNGKTIKEITNEEKIVNIYMTKNGMEKDMMKMAI